MQYYGAFYRSALACRGDIPLSSAGKSWTC
jgi:hypothetical protein